MCYAISNCKGGIKMFRFEYKKEPFKLRPRCYEIYKQYRQGDLEALAIIGFFAVVAIAIGEIVTKTNVMATVLLTLQFFGAVFWPDGLIVVVFGLTASAITLIASAITMFIADKLDKLKYK